MDNALQGKKNRDQGNIFEHQIEATFETYMAASIAHLSMYPVPMRPTGQRHPVTKQPLYAEKGKAPFDVWGWLHHDGRVIGAELKCTNERAVSLPIVVPDAMGQPRKGTGLQFHQLDSLKCVAHCGGLARLVWNNAGEVGVLRGDAIKNAWTVAWNAWRTDIAGKHSKPGSKSIKWDLFEVVGYKGLVIERPPVLAWLLHDKEI